MHSVDDLTRHQPPQQQQQQRVISIKGALLGLFLLLICLFVEEINELRVETKRLMGASYLKVTPEDASSFAIGGSAATREP